jgi:hypothetical protein
MVKVGGYDWPPGFNSRQSRVLTGSKPVYLQIKTQFCFVLEFFCPIEEAISHNTRSDQSNCIREHLLAIRNRANFKNYCLDFIGALEFLVVLELSVHRGPIHRP